MTEDELQDMNRRIRLLEEFEMNYREEFEKITYEAPDKPREGMIRFADGTTWDPGSGRGLYLYVSGAWSKL